MPQIVTFDPIALRIIEVDIGGDNVLDADEIYSEWKDWLLASPGTRVGHPPAFARVDGGDALPSGSLKGAYFPLINGWKFRPAERDHRVQIVGNIYSQDGSPISVPTLGAFNVNVDTEVSPQALIVSSVQLETIAAAVLDALLSNHDEPGSVGEQINRGTLR